MPTKLKETKRASVSRMCDYSAGYLLTKELAVTLSAVAGDTLIELRPFKCRKTYSVLLSTVFVDAVKRDVQAEARTKAKAQRERRKEAK